MLNVLFLDSKIEMTEFTTKDTINRGDKRGGICTLNLTIEPQQPPSIFFFSFSAYRRTESTVHACGWFTTGHQCP